MDDEEPPPIESDDLARAEDDEALASPLVGEEQKSELAGSIGSGAAEEEALAAGD